MRADPRAALAALVALTLAGCDARPPADTSSSRAERDPIAAESTFVQAPPAPKLHKSAPAATPAPAGAPLPPPAPDAMQSRDPAVVLSAWGHAVEARDWTHSRAFWGDHGTMSGLSPQAFAKRWSVLKKPRVTIDVGLQEGAAGSLYYTAPVTLTDMDGQRGERRLAGQVVLRRVNDVDGATSEQLRWHIEKSSVTP